MHKKLSFLRCFEKNPLKFDYIYLSGIQTLKDLSITVTLISKKYGLQTETKVGYLELTLMFPRSYIHIRFETVNQMIRQDLYCTCPSDVSKKGLVNETRLPSAFSWVFVRFRNQIVRLKMVIKIIFLLKFTLKLQEIVENGQCKIKI